MLTAEGFTVELAHDKTAFASAPAHSEEQDLESRLTEHGVAEVLSPPAVDWTPHHEFSDSSLNPQDDTDLPGSTSPTAHASLRFSSSAAQHLTRQLSFPTPLGPSAAAGAGRTGSVKLAGEAHAASPAGLRGFKSAPTPSQLSPSALRAQAQLIIRLEAAVWLSDTVAVSLRKSTTVPSLRQLCMRAVVALAAEDSFSHRSSDSAGDKHAPVLVSSRSHTSTSSSSGPASTARSQLSGRLSNFDSPPSPYPHELLICADSDSAVAGDGALPHVALPLPHSTNPSLAAELVQMRIGRSRTSSRSGPDGGPLSVSFARVSDSSGIAPSALSAFTAPAGQVALSVTQPGVADVLQDAADFGSGPIRTVTPELSSMPGQMDARSGLTADAVSSDATTGAASLPGRSVPRLLLARVPHPTGSVPLTVSTGVPGLGLSVRPPVSPVPGLRAADGRKRVMTPTLPTMSISQSPSPLNSDLTEVWRGGALSA